MRNDDLISRDALIMAIRDAHIISGTSMAIMLDIVKKAPTVGGWISVEDELPEMATLALVCDASSGKMAVARYIANNQWVLPAFFPAVTHWAPLPEAPKEVDDERSNGNA